MLGCRDSNTQPLCFKLGPSLGNTLCQSIYALGAGSTNYYIDEFGSQCLSVFRSLGFPSFAVFLRDLPSDLKKRNDMKKTCISSLASQFPEDCKVYPADTKDDLHKFMSLFKEQKITVPHWRTQRPYLMAQKVDMAADGSGKCTLLVTGYLRARNLSVNQLVHVSGAGDFQLGKIELLKDLCSLNVRKEGDLMDADEVDDSQDNDNLTKEQIEEDIRKIKDAHAEDEEYPDEADAPVDVPARKRFAKYRGLKSFRTSSWDPKESLPLEYARIFAFDNFNRTQKHVLSKARDMEQGNVDEGVPANSYVTLHIREVPVHIASNLCILSKTTSVITCGLLQHESKISVLHFRIKKHETYSEPMKAKELIFHVGFRQFVTRPTFASDNFNSDKHKMERFLHAGRFPIAPVYAPISFPSLPLIAFKSRDGSLAPVLAAVIRLF